MENLYERVTSTALDAAYLKHAGGSSGLKIVGAGVLRNAGSGWNVLDDANHDCIGIASVTSDTSFIHVTLDATNIPMVSAIVVPDETLAKAGFTAGVSYNAPSFDIYLGRPGMIADYISYSGSAWTSQQGVFTGLMSFSNGDLTVTNPGGQLTPGGVAHCTGRGTTGTGSLIPLISETASAVVPGSCIISWFNPTTAAKVTSVSTAMKCCLSRPTIGAVDPSLINTTTFPASNLWFFALARP